MTTEQRIAIAANYNATHIEMIKQLMEEEAVAFEIWIREQDRKGNKVQYGKLPTQVYELYQQQK